MIKTQKNSLPIFDIEYSVGPGQCSRPFRTHSDLSINVGVAYVYTYEEPSVMDNQHISTEVGDVVSRPVDIVEEAVLARDAEVEVVVLLAADLKPNTSTDLVNVRFSESSSPTVNPLGSKDPIHLHMEMESTLAINPSKVTSTEDVDVENTETPMVEEWMLVSVCIRIEDPSTSPPRPTKSQGI